MCKVYIDRCILSDDIKQLYNNVTKMLKKKFGPVLRQYLVVITANLSLMCLGLNIAWASPALVKLSNKNETVLARPITEQEGSWIASVGILCSIFMNLFTGYLVDRVGRKKCIVLACVPRVFVCLLYTFATEVWVLLLGRALDGFSDMVLLAGVVTYASEVASKEIRGALGTISQVSSSFGMLIMLVMGPFVTYFTLNVVYTCVVGVVTIPLFFLPDSPYFLYSQGRIEDSLKLLTFLRGSELLAKEEINEYSHNANIDTKISKWKLLKDRTVLKSFLMVVFICCTIQLLGYNAVTFYLQSIFESTQTSFSPEIASVIIGCIQLFACFCTILLTDRYGRKPILSSTLFGMTVGMIGLGVFFKWKEHHEISGFMNYLPLISIMLVIYCFNAGPGSLLWMLCAELFEGPARAFGVSTGISVATIFTFLIINFFSLIVSTIGPAVTYWIFSVISLITCVFIIIFIPETKGKTFSEIQEALKRGVMVKGSLLSLNNGCTELVLQF